MNKSLEMLVKTIVDNNDIVNINVDTVNIIIENKKGKPSIRFEYYDDLSINNGNKAIIKIKKPSYIANDVELILVNTRYKSLYSVGTYIVTHQHQALNILEQLDIVETYKST